MFRDGGDAPRTPEEVKAMEGYGGSDDWIVMPLSIRSPACRCTRRRGCIRSRSRRSAPITTRC